MNLRPVTVAAISARNMAQNTMNTEQQSKDGASCPPVQGSAQVTPRQFFWIVKLLAVSSEAQASSKAQRKRPARKKDMDPCDFSTGKPQAAEVYLNHEASLSKHSSKNTQKDLASVVPNADGYLEERRCTEHAEPLDCYCQDDLACVCVMCSIVGSHKGHSIVTLKEENNKQRVRSFNTAGHSSTFQREYIGKYIAASGWR